MSLPSGPRITIVLVPRAHVEFRMRRRPGQWCEPLFQQCRIGPCAVQLLAPCIDQTRQDQLAVGGIVCHVDSPAYACCKVLMSNLIIFSIASMTRRDLLVSLSCSISPRTAITICQER